jgi:hypothetical protein
MNEQNQTKTPPEKAAVTQGGYSARFSYERGRRRSGGRMKTAAVVVLFLILSVFSVLGVVALAKGAFSPTADGAGNTILVPSQNQLSLAAKGTADMVKAALPDAVILQGNGNLWWGGSLHKAYQWVKQADVNAEKSFRFPLNAEGSPPRLYIDVNAQGESR